MMVLEPGNRNQLDVAQTKRKLIEKIPWCQCSLRENSTTRSQEGIFFFFLYFILFPYDRFRNVRLLAQRVWAISWLLMDGPSSFWMVVAVYGDPELNISSTFTASLAVSVLLLQTCWGAMAHHAHCLQLMDYWWSQLFKIVFICCLYILLEKGFLVLILAGEHLCSPGIQYKSNCSTIKRKSD